MTERPILFQADMIRAIRRKVGPKTQTRRLRGLERINAEPDAWKLLLSGHVTGVWVFGRKDDTEIETVRCPYGVAGDRLWCKETWTGTWQGDGTLHIVFAADGSEYSVQPLIRYVLPKAAAKVGNWVSPLFLPRWASRDTLEVISARPERLQSITEADAIAEGCEETPMCTVGLVGDDLALARALGTGSFTAKFEYMHLWDSINAKRQPWAKNPYVWRVEFRRLSGAALEVLADG